MKSFSTAYHISRKENKAEKETLIEQEHIKIVAAMKHEFGINNFGTLTEAEKKSYRSMLNEMWTRENGLTEKGIKFLTESVAPLTKDSTPEQIEKQFKKIYDFEFDDKLSETIDFYKENKGNLTLWNK